MQIQSKLIRLCLILLVAALSACQANAETGTPTSEGNVVLTAAAETAAVRLTQASLQNTATPTATQGSPTPELALTAAFATVSAQLTQQARLTPSPTSTQATPAATAGASNLAERALYVEDVTIPDGTDLAPGAAFTKTWRLKNTGASTWTTAYALAFISGDKLGGPDRVNLPSTVAPGATVDISVNLVAPSGLGTYRGFWKIVNASGKFVEDPVFVLIDVVQGASATVPVGTITATLPSTALTLTNVSMAVDANSYTGVCPHAFTFTGRFTLNQQASVTYKVEAGSDIPDFTFNLPSEKTLSFPAGEQTLVFTFTFESSQTVNGWVRLHIIAPIDVTSNQASFSLTCQE
jgi:hypothetical protein